MLCTYRCLTHLKKLGIKMELPILENRALASQLRAACNLGRLPGETPNSGSVRRATPLSLPSTRSLWLESHRIFHKRTGQTIHELFNKIKSEFKPETQNIDAKARKKLQS